MADFMAFLRTFKDDQNTIRLPRQHLPQPDGGVCDEGPGAPKGAGGCV